MVNQDLRMNSNLPCSLQEFHESKCVFFGKFCTQLLVIHLDISRLAISSLVTENFRIGV